MRSATHTVSARRLALGYVVLALVAVGGVSLAVSAGSTRRSPAPVGGVYELRGGPACLGDRVIVEQSGAFLSLHGEDARAGLRLRDGAVEGSGVCEGRDVAVEGRIEGRALALTVGGQSTEGSLAETLEPEEGAAEDVPERTGEETFGRLMLAVAAVILAARLMGALVSRIGQPRVMGEVLAGILLGPTLLGAVAPGAAEYLFPADIVPLLSAGADIGLVFYMFLVGLELDPAVLRGRVRQAAFISQGGIVVPMVLGMLLAVPLFTRVGPPTPFLPFALFIGVSMSITAFPVLARILVERRMLRRPVGALAIGAAAVDDVTAWALLALASGVATTGGVSLGLARIVGLAILFSAFMFLVGRRLLARVAGAYDEAGHVPAGWIAAIFVGVLLSAYVASSIPIAAIFGAFVMGLIMPRRADLSRDVSHRLEDFVTTVLLPLFFATTGLKTQVGLIDRPELWILTLVVIGVAVLCKWTGAMGAARFAGMGFRESSVVGALMNTRGLTELIVLNIGLELGVVTPALFTMLVLMALVTTFMTGPALRLLDPKGVYSAPPQEEVREAPPVEAAALRAPVPDRRVIVAPQDEHNLDALVALSEPLARAQPPRELLLVRLIVPPRGATSGLLAGERALSVATEELGRRRDDLLGRDIAARAVAFTSADPGRDLVRLATDQDVDLVMLDGRRPLLGEGVPRGDIGTVLEEAPCDVAVLVEREAAPPAVGEGRPVVVPFGGAEHDWAALELGAWLASDRGASLRLLGTSADPAGGERDASRLLASASLAVQQLAGIPTEPALVPPEGVVDGAAGAGLLVVGLSDRWRQEGLGPVRRELARGGGAPVLFVRRGTRPGALAGREDVTRFTWSQVGPGGPAAR